MPWLFLVTGTIFLLAGLRGESANLLALLESDFQGSNNFVYWFLSILILGALGYVDALRGFSRAFMALVLIVLILAEDKQATAAGGGGGFFAEFASAVKQITGG